MTLRQQAVVTALRKLETEYKATANAHADAPDYLYYCGKRDAISAAIIIEDILPATSTAA